MQGIAAFALPGHLAIETRVSYVMRDIKRVKAYGEDLTELGDCDPQIGVVCSGYYRCKPLLLSGKVVIAHFRSYLASYKLEVVLLAQEHFNNGEWIEQVMAEFDPTAHARAVLIWASLVALLSLSS